MQSVNNNPIKSITINKSQCSNKSRIFKIQTSCSSAVHKHRAHSASRDPCSAASPTGSFLGKGRRDGQHVIKIYCQGEHTHLLLAFFYYFNDKLILGFFCFFFPYLLHEVYLRQKLGRFFCTISKQNTQL